MIKLIKTLAVVAAGVMLATSALAQSATEQIEHHIAKIDGISGEQLIIVGLPPGPHIASQSR
jgi:hypothetical protein